MSWEKGNANNNEHEKSKKNKVLWPILMLSTWTAAQCSPVTLADIATATVCEAEWPSDNSPYLLTVTLIGYRCPAVHQIYTKTFPGYLRLRKRVCACILPTSARLSALPAPHPPPPTPSLSGSKLVHLQKIPTTLTLIQLKASGCAKNMSSHCLLHIMIIDRAGLTEARILHTSAVHNWSDNSPWSAGCSNRLQRFR